MRYEFTSAEPIDEYYSYIGSNDIVYPVAVSETYAYFMLEHVYVSKHRFPSNIDWMQDAYLTFYNMKKNKRRMKGYKIINKEPFP